MDELAGSDLLLLLQALLLTGGPAENLRGHVAVGIQGPERTLWWEVSITDRVEARFPKRAPPEADAILLLGEAEALAILTGAELPAKSRIEIQGDWTLMEQLIDRFVSERKRREGQSGSHRLSRSSSQSGLSQRIRRSASGSRLRTLRGMTP